MVLIVLDHWLNDAMVLMDRCGLLSSVHDSISDSIIVLLIASTGVLTFPTCKRFGHLNYQRYHVAKNTSPG